VPPVLTKADFTRRYKAGEFGNASPTWDTVQEYLASGYNQGPIHIRNRVAGGPTWYDVKPGEVLSTYTEIVGFGKAKSEELYFSAMAPTPLTTLQGEWMLDTCGIPQLYYSRIAKPMRASLAEGGKQASGLVARALTQAFMNYRSLAWFEWLKLDYPEHVIEFSCYSRCWGTVPGHNTVFWEVRKYLVLLAVVLGGSCV
jgi:hypothetical protein